MALTASELAALKSTLEFWEVIEYGGAFAVLVGVIGEYIAEFTRFAEKRGLARPLGKLSTLVLIAGLAVELTALVSTNRLSGELIASLEQSSSAALERAGNAEERAKKYEGEIAKANAGAAEARKQSAKANERAAEALKAAEQERLARVKIEAQLAWRDLERPKQDRIIARISAFKGQRYEILTYPENREAIALAMRIGGALEAALWAPSPADGVLGFTLILGVQIHIAPSRKGTFGEAAEALASALRSVGIAAEVKSEAWQDEAANAKKAILIQIRVGQKP